MRIFLLLAVAAGAAAIGTAAPARPAGKSAGPPGAWAATGGHHRAVTGWQARSRPGLGRDRGDRRRGGRRPDRGDLFFHDGFGIAEPLGIVTPYGNGFFAGGGGEVRMKGGRPHYDYDRSYPYEWAPAARGDPERAEEAEEERWAEPPPRCTFEHGVRVCRGW